MLSTHSELRSNQILRLKDVMLMTGLSRSTIYDKQNPSSKRFDPSFPQKIKLGARAVGWLMGDMQTWVNLMRNNSIAGRD
ncbi:hypothetical protein OAW_17725 [Vibrio cyclitrophicus ZF170]|uniref:AlpA family phage regulatory protein n=1 Tax=Vibrio cyclitrophicus TaxID=47951 RepID=UPI0002DE5D7B|nr:AlpA family phage regulatory protein [Vibrio cyclitrophicus]OEE27503.1 hypothetical protein OAW_17725 [Vibrio cyclitrophicus ZF170]